MTPTQLKYSRLMAEFMGWVFIKNEIIFSNEYPNSYYRHPKATYGEYLKNMQYHTSYDSLMPVWVKFRGLKFKKTSDQIDYHHHHQHFVRLLNYGEIEQAFEALGKAIEWLNENKLLC